MQQLLEELTMAASLPPCSAKTKENSSSHLQQLRAVSRPPGRTEEIILSQSVSQQAGFGSRSLKLSQLQLLIVQGRVQPAVQMFSKEEKVWGSTCRAPGQQQCSTLEWREGELLQLQSCSWQKEPKGGWERELLGAKQPMQCT